MLKQMNTYFGNASVRHFFFFGSKICYVTLSGNTNEATLFFVIYDLLFHEFHHSKVDKMCTLNF